MVTLARPRAYSSSNPEDLLVKACPESTSSTRWRGDVSPRKPAISALAQMSMSCALLRTPPAGDMVVPSRRGTSAIRTGSPSSVIMYGEAVEPAPGFDHRGLLQLQRLEHPSLQGGPPGAPRHPLHHLADQGVHTVVVHPLGAQRRHWRQLVDGCHGQVFGYEHFILGSEPKGVEPLQVCLVRGEVDEGQAIGQGRVGGEVQLGQVCRDGLVPLQQALVDEFRHGGGDKALLREPSGYRVLGSAMRWLSRFENPRLNSSTTSPWFRTPIETPAVPPMCRSFSITGSMSFNAFRLASAEGGGLFRRTGSWAALE